MFVILSHMFIIPTMWFMIVILWIIDSPQRVSSDGVKSLVVQNEMWKTFIFMAHIPVYINTFPFNESLFAEFPPKAALAL